MSAAEFEAQVLRFERSLETQSDRVVQGVALEIAHAIIAGGRYGGGDDGGTPVDTGFLRSSWRASRNRPDTGEGVAGTSANPSPPPDLSAGVIGAKVGEVLYFTNSAEYAEIVEERQAFVAPIVANIPLIVADVARLLGEAP